jgi:hypothetical protein
MSKFGSTDGLNSLARYMSVVAIAAASAGSLPKNVFEDASRNDQIAIEQKDDQLEGGADKA